MRHGAIGLLVAGSLAVAACFGTTTGPSGPACRTYATAGRYAYTKHRWLSGTFTSAYDVTTNRWTTDFVFTDTTGTIETQRTVTSFQSVAAFVDELATSPPLALSTNMVSTGAFDYLSTNTFDAQRRQTSQTLDGGEGNPYVSTYTAWDGAGRPTAGRQLARNWDRSLAMVYDDASRTVTRTETSGTQVTTFVEVYDTNGELAHRTQSANYHPDVVTRATTVSSTAQVCK
jgi:hypothetical protein